MPRRMGVLVAAAVLALAGCSSGGTVLETSAPEASATPAFLASAAERTASVETGSIELHITAPDGTVAITGQFDTTRPAGTATITGTGFEGADDVFGLTGDLNFEVVFDDSTVYMKLGALAELFGATGDAPWIKFDADQAGFGSLGDIGAGEFGVTGVNPDELLAELRAEGIEVTEVGAEDVRGVATTHYAATVPADANAVGGESADVDVWIDADGLVRRVKVAASGDEPFTLDAELFDLGEPIDITVPPADQVMDLGDLSGFNGGGLFGPKPR